jgi:hypothetical protein
LNSFAKRQFFNFTFELPKEIDFILVRCNGTNATEVYSNVHAVIRRNSKAQKTLDESNRKLEKPLNVVILGIDSISRLHFMRSMSETYQHVEDSGWFSLHGYNIVSYKIKVFQ